MAPGHPLGILQLAPLVMFAFSFGGAAFIPGHINKQCQNHVDCKHRDDGSVEVAVRAGHFHSTWKEEAMRLSNSDIKVNQICT